MKIVDISTGKSTLLKSEFEKNLGMKITAIERCDNDDNCLKILTIDNKLIYLLCQDVQDLMGLDYNIFSEDIKIDKKFNVTINKDDSNEIFRGSVKKWKKQFKN